jgi:hypothetical protein
MLKDDWNISHITNVKLLHANVSVMELDEYPPLLVTNTYEKINFTPTNQLYSCVETTHQNRVNMNRKGHRIYVLLQ